jgi:crotonobetainyl-CoA:carnitine CoA-transferase CaiB-like acyl-CoA transferase
MSAPQALAGVRILDLCDQKGAYCGKLLGDMGADVILVEPPSGSPMRAIGPFHPRATDRRNASLFFRHYNTGKRSIIVDLDSVAGRRDLLRLVRRADAVIESHQPGYLAARGLGYQHLAGANPGIVLTSITPFGQSGPYRDLRGCDLVAQALGGLVYANGAADAEPLQGIGLQAYHSAAIWAAIGCLLSLLDRERSGRGQWVDVDIHACAAAALEHAASLYRETGAIARRTGGLHWTRLFRTGPCGDGYVAHGVAGDWTALAEWVNGEHGGDLSDARWNDPDYRRENCDRLFATLDAWAADRPAEELAEAAQLRRLPYAALRPLASLPAHPQLRARNYFVPVEYESESTALLHAGAPYKFSHTPWRIARRAPRLGEHSAELSEATFADAPSRPDPARASGRELSLAGIRVVDFTWAVAGPLATRVLADHGADVIKIERPGVAPRTSVAAVNLNRGKRSVAIDMSDARGVALARALIVRSDVVMDNFSPRVMPNWGLDDGSLRRAHPRLISVGMSGFGAGGPLRDHVSYGPTLQAAAGHSLLMPSSGEPSGWGFSYSDTAAGHTAALAVLIALWFRRRSGRGQRIDLSQFESLIAVTGPALLAMQTMSVDAPGNGSQEGDAAPHGVFRCLDEPADRPAGDRWCAIAVFGDDDWQRFTAALGSPAWAREPRFATLAGRQRHAAALAAHIARWTAGLTAEEVMQRLQAAGIAAGVVANARDLCERNAHLRQRGYWIPTHLPDGRTVEIDGVPLLRSAGSRLETAPSAPQVGQDTETVLNEILHLDAAAIDELRRAGVVAGSI